MCMPYAIDKAFFPFSHFAPPIRSARMAEMMNIFIRPPVGLLRDKEIAVTKETLHSADGQKINVFVMQPRGVQTDRCLVYLHGGGFFFGAAGYHYKNAKQYCLQTPCKVVFVDYRLTPKHPFPMPAEDCFAAWLWTHENADRLGIHKEKIAVGGDSAGGALAAAVSQMARDRNASPPLFQLLVYPVTDRRMQYESHKKFTDTPMWNSKLNVKMWDGYLPDPTVKGLCYASPMEADSFENLPPAFVETAEFDCLHDEGIAYADALLKAGVAVTVNETKGTMHGYDIVQRAPAAKNAIAKRIQFMQACFEE
ncbi:MAG: alpha/beta hydrolase [Ruminococcaceae bacterium]|nr:alpha/beta hydrolase [Oscillospiraceae bacterium]